MASKLMARELKDNLISDENNRAFTENVGCKYTDYLHPQP